MSQKWLLGESPAFDPDTIKAMESAYDHLCTALNLVVRDDPLTEAVAKSIIEHARRGERNPISLSALVLKDLRSTYDHG